ncbi:hypothetical protein EXD82_01315 [Peptacetobacter hominis]|uniref:HNH domain-containing protein n=1 Tax=Peptacetobacter hominis TaxID=2743610 RepID=A0A544QXN3_9FIRM|nr:HNH endonuclease [Peptacetobacter hominis]TQQ85413.1 hypothetical protein EXD82_01315 [Peptacetobacter hominis]
MIKVDRSFPAPKSLEKKKSYTEEDILNQLYHDFYGKCYICGIDKLQDPEVEHLRPHKNGKYVDRKYDWKNLFLSCGHCNSIKNISKYEENIIDCCKIDSEEFISFRFIDNNVVVTERDTDNYDAVNTAELVFDVFNKKNTGMRVIKSDMRLSELKEEINAFYVALERYKEDKGIIPRRILRGFLKRSSAFAEYKRGYIRDNEDEYPELMEYISEN